MGSMTMQKKFFSTPSRGNTKCESRGNTKYDSSAYTKKEVDSLQMPLLHFGASSFTDEPASIDQSVFLNDMLRDVSSGLEMSALLDGNYYIDEFSMPQDPQPGLEVMQGVEAFFPSQYILPQQQQQQLAHQHLQQYQPQQPHQSFFDPTYHLSFPSQPFTSSSEMPSTLQPLSFQSPNAYPQMVDPAPISSPMATSPMVYAASSPGPFCPPSPDAYSSNMTVYPSPSSTGYASPTSPSYASPSMSDYPMARAESTKCGVRRRNTRTPSHYQLSTSVKSRAKPKGRLPRGVTDMSDCNREIFQCDKCPKTFDRRYNFVQHHKTHSEIKEYRCDFPGCDSAFHRKADMQRHRLRHTGELPIECPFCTVRFRRVEAQKRHCQQEHRDAYLRLLDEKRQQKEMRALKKGLPRC